MRNVGYTQLYPWSGGLNTAEDPIIADDQDLQIADNIVFTTSASRKKRGGQAHVNSVALPVATAAQNVIYVKDYWSDVGGTKRQAYFTVLANSNVYYSLTGTTYTQRNTTTLTTAHGQITTAVFNQDLIYGYSTSAPPRFWDGQSTAATGVFLALPTAPNGNIVQLNRNRVWLAGNSSFKDRVYYSAPFDHTNWTGGTAGSIDVFPGDGDPDGITAIFPEINQGGLYVAKRTKLYFIDNSSLDAANWPVRLVSDSIGCVGPNAYASIDQEDVIFVSDRGVHSLGQVLSGTAVILPKFISAPIHPDFTNEIDAIYKKQISMAWYPTLNSVMMACRRQTPQTQFETIYAFNVVLQKWYRWTSVPCNFLTTRFNGSTKMIELIAAANSGYINKLDQTALNDFGAAISTTIKSMAIYPEGIFPGEKHFLNIVFLFRSRGNYTFDYVVDIDNVQSVSGTVQQRVNGGNILGTTLLGPAFVLGEATIRMKPYFEHIKGVGHSVEVTIQQNGLNQDLEIFGMALEYKNASESQNPYRLFNQAS